MKPGRKIWWGSFVSSVTLAMILPLAAESPLPTTQVVEIVKPAVVEIRSALKESVSLGSGFVIEPDGVIVTALHVVKDARRIDVRLLSGEVFTVSQVLAVAEQHDLCLLKIPAVGLPTLRLADSDALQIGENVIFVGNPEGLTYTVSKGIASAVRVVNGSKVIQVDAAASHGSSGGPLVNERGEVVGVCVFGWPGVENGNFAASSNYIKGLLSAKTPLSLTEAWTSHRASDLFSESSSGLAGRWKSVTSGTIKVITDTGDRIYVETLEANGNPTGMVADLVKQADGSYNGISRWHFSCWYMKGMGAFMHKVEKSCDMENSIQLRLASDGRIEGVWTGPEMPDQGTGDFKDYCRTCGESEKPVSSRFTWFRQQ